MVSKLGSEHGVAAQVTPKKIEAGAVAPAADKAAAPAAKPAAVLKLGTEAKALASKSTGKNEPASKASAPQPKPAAGSAGTQLAKQSVAPPAGATPQLPTKPATGQAHHSVPPPAKRLDVRA